MKDDSRLSDCLQLHLQEFENQWFHWDPQSAVPPPAADQAFRAASNDLQQCTEEDQLQFVTELVYVEIWHRQDLLGDTPSPDDYLDMQPFCDFPEAVNAAFGITLAQALSGNPTSPLANNNANNNASSDSMPARFGRYEVIEKAGEGGFGEVYKCHDPNAKRNVAIKVATGAMGEALLKTREIGLQVETEHEGIVRIYDVGYDGPPQAPTYVVMQYIEGMNLKSRLGEKSYEVPEAVELMLQIATSVHHAHQNGILHLDLKPANILLDQQGQPWVSDFGLAVHKQSVIDHTSRGTPGYMSPYQWQNLHASELDDIFSLGVVLYEVLTQRLPFDTRQLTPPLPPLTLPSELVDGIPPELDNFVCKCLLEVPGEAYQSLEPLIEDLRRLRDKLRAGPDVEQRSRARQLERSAIANLIEDRPHDAISSLREAVASYPVNAYADYLLGLAYLMTKDVTAGIRALERSLKLDKNHHWSHYALGYVYYVLGDLVRAKGYVEEALAQAPTRAIYDLAAQITLRESQRGEPGSEETLHLTNEVDLSVKMQVADAAREVLRQDRASRMELHHWTEFLPPWRYLGKSPFLLSAGLAIVCLSFTLWSQTFDWSNARAVQQFVIWCLIWMGLYGPFVVAKMVERAYHQVLPAIAGWNETEFRVFFVTQSRHVLGRTCAQAIRDVSIFTAIKKNIWQILPAAILFLILIPYQYICAGDGEIPADFPQFMRYVSYFIQVYFLTWILSMAIFGLAFIPRFRIVPTRFFLEMPESTSLKPIGTMYLHITLWLVAGYSLAVFQNYVFATFVEPLVNISYIVILATIVLLNLSFPHVFVFWMMSKVKMQKCVEYSFHLEAAFEEALRNPSSAAFQKLAEREQFMKRIRQVDVFGLSRIDTITLIAASILFVGFTVAHYVLVLNGWWIFDPEVARFPYDG